MTDRELFRTAMEMTQKSYAPFSKFRVGAALLAKDGTVYTGCNVENSSFGGTICAERTAVTKAVSEGALKFTAIAVVGSGSPAWPCGICRQVLREFSDLSLPVIVGQRGQGFTVKTLGELLPESFGPETMGVRSET